MRLALRWLFVVCALVSGVARAQAPDAPGGRKGLQVQMVDDALALGIHHAALNCNLGQLFAAAGGPDAVAFEQRGVRHWFSRSYLESLDAQIRPLSARGVQVSLILIAIATGDPAKDALLLHPGYDAAAPNHIGANNIATAAGREWLGAACACLSERWAGGPAGRVRNWIVGNEVNSHWWWWNLGRAELPAVAAAYAAAVRIVHDAVQAGGGRVFVSLEHHWQSRHAAGDARQSAPGRELLSAFAAAVRAGGDFEWHVAFHPYPEDLFECRFWLDRSAPDADDAPRVTFRNLPVLGRFLQQPELRWRGGSRRVILSEQGFHCADRADGERDQAAAYAAAWQAVAREPWIDAFILHRHVDHAHEGGLKLGLWTNKPGSVCDPDRQRAMAAVFRDCDGPDAAKALAFALPVLGIASWDELPARLGHRPAAGSRSAGR